MTESLHHQLVDTLKRDGSIRTPAVEAAFRAVPRHPFLPAVALEEVYQDEAIPTRRSADGTPVSSSSQPAAMAIMLEQLDVRPGHRVLEIGAGTGYNAALLAHLAGEAGEVVSIDIDEDIVAAAREHLAAVGLGSERVRVGHGDGGLGFPEAAPYDRIVLTVGAWDVVPAWHEQLAEGGRLLLPLWFRGAQKTVAFERADGPHRPHLASVSVSGCAFMRLRGAFAGPEAFVALDPNGGLALTTEDRDRIDAAAAFALLASPHRNLPTPVRLGGGEVWGSLCLWLALHNPAFCTLSAEAGATRAELVPHLLGSTSFRYTIGLFDGAALAVLTRARPPGQPPPAESGDATPATFPLAVRSHGPNDRLAQRLIADLAAWDAAARPNDEWLRLRAYPLPTAYIPTPGETVVDKRWTRLVVSWDDARAED